jgi:chromosome segregation ATPase
MRRQIDPEFFKDTTALDDREEVYEPSPAWAVIKKLEDEVERLSQGQQKIALRISQLESRWEERLLSAIKKMEKLGHGLERMEEYISQFKKETLQMATQLNHKVSERRISDARLEDLLQRHNSVLQQFEARMMTFQKHLQDKDLQLINYAEGLKEARKEMAKIKSYIQGI